MRGQFDVVVSCENNAYTAWMAVVLHHSCRRWWKRTPLIMVHGDEEDGLQPLFQGLRDRGGRIQRAPSYAWTDKGYYQPRNTVASLMFAGTAARYILLLDPDMIFVRRPPSLPLLSEQVTMDHVNYLRVDEENTEVLRNVCMQFGVHFEMLTMLGSYGGVPYIVPVALRSQLARRWLEVVEALRVADPHMWVGSMWGFIIAAMSLDIDILITHHAFNKWPTIDMRQYRNKYLMHYYTGNEVFDKRSFREDQLAVFRQFGQPCDVGMWADQLLVDEVAMTAKAYGLRT